MRIALIGGSRLEKIKKPLEAIGVDCIVLRSWLDLVRKIDPPIDAVITDTPGTSIVKGFIVKMINRVPLIYRMRGNYWQEIESEHKLSKIRILIADKIILSMCDGIVVVNRYLKRECFKRIGRAERILKMGLPIDPIKIKRSSGEFDAVTLTNFDYWEKIKPILYYADVVNEFLKEVGGKWFIAGKGKYARKFLREIERFENVEYCGFVRKEEMLKKGEVMLHFSEFEGLPNAVLEGLSAGLPVIVNDYEPLKDLEVVIVIKDKDDLKRWLIELYDNAKLRRKLKRRNIKYILKVKKKYTKELNDLIKFIIELKSRKR